MADPPLVAQCAIGTAVFPPFVLAEWRRFSKDSGMQFPRCNLRHAASAALLACVTHCTGLAGPILQGPTDTFLAFEAETNGVINNGAVQSFTAILDEAASSGQALQVIHPTNPAFNAGGTDGSTATSFVTYSLNFLNPGTYTLYDTVRTDAATLALDVNAGNSFVFSSNFGGPVDTRSNSNNTASLTSYTFFSEIQTFTVDAPGSYTFTIGDREAGTTIDRFIFSSTPIADKAAFDAVPNSIPEPSSLMLLALAAGAAASSRRRRA